MFTVVYTYSHAHGITMAKYPSMGALVSAALIDHLDMYDQIEDIHNYRERLDLSFTANDIPISKQTAVLLSAVGPTVYKTVKSLAEPTPVSEKSYKDICDKLTSHYKLTSHCLAVAERFRFYKRDKQSEQTVAQYAVTPEFSQSM